MMHVAVAVAGKTTTEVPSLMWCLFLRWCSPADSWQRSIGGLWTAPVSKSTDVNKPPGFYVKWVFGFLKDFSLGLDQGSFSEGVGLSCRTRLTCWLTMLGPLANSSNHYRCHHHLGGGFKYLFIFTPIWGRLSFWLIFFRWVETTNQSSW